MDNQVLIGLIRNELDQILDAKGLPRVGLNGDMALLDGTLPIDSLDLAQIVLQLQSSTGRDPFANGFVEFRTVEELVSLFSA